MDISICITTFKKRFEMFKQLILNIRKEYPEINIITIINGEYEEDFCNTYRENILDFISSQKNVFPIMIPEFRALPKLWNNLVIFSKTEYNLILSDDVYFNSPTLIEQIEEYSKFTGNKLFTLNNSWAHFVVTKTSLNDIGYFDERLLTLGYEDGDIVWRHIDKYQTYIPNLAVDGVCNLADYESKPTNMECHIDNKPTFNFTFIMEKYKQTPSSTISGMFGKPYSKIIEDKVQYPYEEFYWENKKNIKTGKEVILQKY